MTKLSVSFDECRYQTREPYSDDEWDRGDTHTDISFNYISLSQKGLETFVSSEKINVGDKVYVVWGHWGSGNTFGHDSGCFYEVFEVTKDIEKANRLSEFLGSVKDNERKDFEGSVYYIPWNGYFDSFEGMYIEETEVLE